jgi:glycosyltransferase involved in cell wall biosynthesis
MISTDLPFVSILTPIYNGEEYLAECIESVLAQTYQDWEYVIVNNCSTDRSLAIAEHYARKDPRIKVLTNTSFVGVIENHNIAFRLISPQSKYCKVVSADDWIYPECIQLLVRVAEKNPSVGIVGAYQLRNNEVRWKGVPLDLECISGREVCRMTFLEDLAIFGPPTSSLYRSELIRKHEPFFTTSLPHADICACYEYLQSSDFGFVHEVLSVERVHHGQVSTRVSELHMNAVASVEYVLKYGPMYLNKSELETILKRYLAIYYRRLGGSVLKMKGKEYWRFHATRMRELGSPISWKKVVWAAIREFVDEIKHPKVGCQKLARVLKERCFSLVRAHR